MLVIKQFGPVTYAMGTLKEILAGTGIAAKVRALPNDVAGCTLEMGADGLWTGNLGTLTQAQADALVAAGVMGSVKAGVPAQVDGVQYTWRGASAGGWVAPSSIAIDVRVGIDAATYSDAVAAASSGMRILLPAGFRIADASWPTPTQGVSIIGDPANPAVFDAYDDTVVTWTKTGGYTNIWQATVYHSWGGTSSPVGATRLSPQMILNGVVYVEKRGALDLATLDTISGGFSVVGLNGGSYSAGWYIGNQTYYINSSVDPNGLSLRVGQRVAPNFGTGVHVENIKTIGGVHRDGVTAVNSTFKNCHFFYSSGHGCIVPGSYLEDVEVAYSNPSTETGYAIHGYSLTPYNELKIVRPWIHDWNGQFCTAFGSHGDGSQVTCKKAIIISPKVERTSAVLGFSDTGYSQIDDLSASYTKTMGGGGQASLIRRAKWFNPYFGSATTGVFGGTGPMTVEDSAIYSQQPLLSGGLSQLNFKRCNLLFGYETNGRWATNVTNLSTFAFDSCIVRSIVRSIVPNAVSFHLTSGSVTFTATNSRFAPNIALPSGNVLTNTQIAYPGAEVGTIESPVLLTGNERKDIPYLGYISLDAITSKVDPADKIMYLTNSGVATLNRSVTIPGVLGAAYINSSAKTYAVCDGTNVVKIIHDFTPASDSTATAAGWDGTFRGIASSESGGVFCILDANGNAIYYNGTSFTVTQIASGMTPFAIIFTNFAPASIRNLYVVLGTVGGVSYTWTSPDGVVWTQRASMGGVFQYLTSENTGVVASSSTAGNVPLRVTTDLTTWANVATQTVASCKKLTFQPYSSIAYALLYKDERRWILRYDHSAGTLTYTQFSEFDPTSLSVRNWVGGGRSNLVLQSRGGLVASLDSNTMAMIDVSTIDSRRLTAPTISPAVDGSGLA